MLRIGQAADNDIKDYFNYAVTAYNQYKKIYNDYINSPEYKGRYCQLYERLPDEKTVACEGNKVNERLVQQLKELNKFAPYNFNITAEQRISLVKFYKVNYAVETYRKQSRLIDLPTIFLNYSLGIEDCKAAYFIFGFMRRNLNSELERGTQPMDLS